MKYTFLGICLFFGYAGAMQEVSKEIPGKSQAVAKVTAKITAAEDLLKKGFEKKRLEEIRDGLGEFLGLLKGADMQESVQEVMNMPQLEDFTKELESLQKRLHEQDLKKAAEDVLSGSDASSPSHVGATVTVEFGALKFKTQSPSEQETVHVMAQKAKAVTKIKEAQEAIKTLSERAESIGAAEKASPLKTDLEMLKARLEREAASAEKVMVDLENWWVQEGQEEKNIAEIEKKVSATQDQEAQEFEIQIAAKCKEIESVLDQIYKLLQPRSCCERSMPGATELRDIAKALEGDLETLKNPKEPDDLRSSTLLWANTHLQQVNTWKMTEFPESCCVMF